MKKLLLIAFLLFPFFAYATSGACSGHGGVDCAAGAGSYGQAICNDGWTGSSVSYASMVECQTTQPSANVDTLFSLKQKCAAYTSTIEDEVIKANLSSEANAKIHPGNSIDTVLGDVFYSPTENSCLYAETSYVKMASWVFEGHTMSAQDYVHYSVNDYLDNESQIYAVDVYTTATNTSKVSDFYSMVDYYKGDAPAQAAQGSANTATQANSVPPAAPPPSIRNTNIPSAASKGMAGLLADAKAAPTAASNNNPEGVIFASSKTQVQATTSAPIASTTPPEPAPIHTSFLHKIYSFFANLFGF